MVKQLFELNVWNKIHSLKKSTNQNQLKINHKTTALINRLNKLNFIFRILERIDKMINNC